MGFGPRPAGVTILAILSGLAALIFLLASFGAVLIISFANNSTFIQALNDSGAPQWIIDNFRIIFLILLLVSLIFMAVYALLAYGFMSGTKWAWTLGICFAAINIVWTVVQFIVLQGTSGVLDMVISIAIPVIILIYLAQSNVKTFFLGGGQMVQPPPGSQL
jgi:hypothetical protein